MHSNRHSYPFLKLPEVNHHVAVPIMLTIYKYGIAEIPSDMATLKQLSQEGLIRTQLIRGHSSCILTEAGASWVTTNLFKMLVECPLYITYPALLSGDEIQVLRDIKHNGYDPENVRFVGPASQMDRGRYFLKLIKRERVVLTDDCGVPYQLNLRASNSVLSFRPDQLSTLDAELTKRFHKIKIKSVVTRLRKYLDILTLTEWVEEMYNLSYTKWRIGE